MIKNKFMYKTWSILFGFALLLGVCRVEAQVTPNAQIYPGAGTQSVRAIPSAYPTGFSYRYVRVWSGQKPITSDTAFVSTARPVQEVTQKTSYVDGLGRPLQDVVKGISPLGYDQVQPFIYDSFGRQTVQYLSYISSTNDGSLKASPYAEQATFMTNLFNPGNNVSGEKFFYSQTDVEPSPLDRTLKSYAPGNSWIGNAVGTSMQYQVNDASDSVVIWSSPTSGSTPSKLGYYPAGKLYKNVTIDERGYSTVEYQDLEGHLILKKRQFASGGSLYTGHTGWYCTYYVYDEIGNTLYIIQPKGVEWLNANNWTFDATVWKNSGIAKELTFSYEYDQFNRMIIKRIPGAGEIWLVYDARDRVVMNQDSLLRAQGKWQYVSYDSINRPTLTGIWTVTGDRSYHQNLAVGSVSYPSPTSNYIILTQTYYDNYNWVSTSGSGLSSSLITSYTTDNSYFYVPSNVTFPYPQSITATISTIGKATGTKTNILGTSNYLYSVNFYDEKGRPIQIQATNSTGGKDTTTLQYSFLGRQLRMLEAHGKQGNNSLQFQVLTKTFYDAAGRMMSMTKRVGNSIEDSIATNSYNELGALVLKKLGRKRTSQTNYAYSTNPIDTLRYTYNPRGWLQGINKDYCNGSNGATNWFGMELSYDYGFNANQLNGNISGIKWKNKSDGQHRAYGFTYDPVNRLTQADFRQDSSGAWLANSINYSVRGISYDANGNMLTMNQMGVKLNTSDLIDSLLYGYNANSNKLNYVTDRKNDTTTLLADFKEYNTGSTQDYSYDGNGNLTGDNNKRIGNIHYNILNLPDSVTFTNKGYIKYIYDADGIKQQKITIDNIAGKKTVTTYQGAFIYQYATTLAGVGLDTLQSIFQQEGRIRPQSVNKSDTVNYDFFERDHLGNTRVVLTDELQQDTYPVATLENNGASMTVEQSYYNINTADTISTSRIASWVSTSGSGYVNNNGNPPYNNNPSSNTSATSSIVYKLNGSTGDKTGLGITLKVMTGDVVNIYGKSFWHNGTGSNPSNTYLINSALNTFIAAFAGTSAVSGAAKGATAGALQGSSQTVTPLANWLTTGVTNPGSSSVPRAYINWILFNDQFVPIASNSGFDLVSTSGDVVKNHNSSVTIGTSGYLYVYCSNESNIDVFFDNLQLVHTRGPLLEASDYYPFGVVMSGINSKTLKFKYQENKYKFNSATELQSKEFSESDGLDCYDAGFRTYDVQLGRFWQLDPLTEINESGSPYSFVNNNPISFNDPYGLADSTKPEAHPKKPTVLPTVIVPGAKKPTQTKPSLARNFPSLPTTIPAPAPTPAPAPAPSPSSPLSTDGPIKIGGYDTPPLDLEGVAEVGAAVEGFSWMPILSRTVGTIGFVLSPLSASQEGPHWRPTAFSGHGNSIDNSNPHIVYEFDFQPPPGDTRTPFLKYGISDEFRFSLDRPENQLQTLRIRYGPSVMYRIITRTSNRELALLIEFLLVQDHIEIWGEKPREQKRP